MWVSLCMMLVSLMDTNHATSYRMEEWKLITSTTQEAKLLNSLHQIQAFRGVGPGLAMELISRSGLSPTMDVTITAKEDWRAVYSVWLDWLGILNESTFKPGLVRSTGSYSVLGGDSPYILFTEQGSELRQQLVAKVSATTKKVQSKVNLFEDQIKASMGYGTIARMADLLMANFHFCKLGASSVILPDFETEEATTIALDPRQIALITAQKLYKRRRGRGQWGLGYR